MHSLTAPCMNAELPLGLPLERADPRARCAFTPPFATAPYSRVSGSGPVTTARMAREGLLLGFAAALIVAAGCQLFPAP